MDFNSLRLRLAYDLAKASRRDPVSGKQYTDRDFAREYMNSDHSMLTKVLSGKAVSQPVVEAIRRFVKDSEKQIADGMKQVKAVIKDKL